MDLEATVLTKIGTSEGIADSLEYALALGVDHQAVVGACKSLLTDLYAVTTSERTDTVWTLTDEGKNVAADGSAEYQVYCSVPAGAEGVSMADLQQAVGEAVKLGLGPCLKNKWLKKAGDMIVKLAADAQDETAAMLVLVGNGTPDSVNAKDLQALKKRKLIAQTNRRVFGFAKGPNYRATRVKKMVEITREMLGDKADMPPGMPHWSDLEFKGVNLNAMGAPVGGGNFHPLLKVHLTPCVIIGNRIE
jgi:phenylalanyl-tRNA synthetase alpha chain